MIACRAMLKVLSLPSHQQKLQAISVVGGRVRQIDQIALVGNRTKDCESFMLAIDALESITFGCCHAVSLCCAILQAPKTHMQLLAQLPSKFRGIP